MTTTVGDVPNQPKTPLMSVRVAREVQDALAAAAKEDGRTVTDVVRQALTEYLARRDGRS